MAIGFDFDGGDKILFPVVNRSIRSQAPANLNFFRRASGCNDLGTERVCQLDGGCSNTAGATVEQ